MEKETTCYYTFYTRLGDMTVGCTASSIVMLSLNSKIFSKSNTNLPDLAYETEKQILEYLDGKGMIDKDKNGNLTKNVYSSCLAKGNRMHVIQMKEADKDSCDASFGNGDCPFGN